MRIEGHGDPPDKINLPDRFSPLSNNPSDHLIRKLKIIIMHILKVANEAGDFGGNASTV
jgi:hypothetical protein